MAFLQYAARAYIIQGTANEPDAPEVYEIGPWYIKYLTPTATSMPGSSTYAQSPEEYWAYFEDPGYIGGSGTGKSANKLAIIQAYNPTYLFNAIPAEYFTSSYRIKLVFANGKFAICNLNLGTSGYDGRYTGYAADSSRIGTVYISTPTNFSDNTDLNYIQYVISNITDKLPQTGLLSAYTFTTYRNIYRYDSSQSPYIQSSSTYQFFSDIEPYTPAPPSTDPYEPGGTSGTGGGTGTFSLASDAIDFPSLPTLSAVSTGLVSIYTPTLAQLNSLANYLWNADPTTVEWWKKLVANPLDLILGLSIVPVSVPAGAAQNVKVGLIDTGVSMTKATTQFVTVDCGSIAVDEYWGSALDYSPFTKFSIYLPFIGTRTINTDDIMGKTLHVKYNVDLLSGACTAMIKADTAVLYQYSGACAISLPLSGETFTNMITSTIQLAASIAGTVASGGAAAGITAASAANSVLSMKPQIERAGGVSGAAGQLGVMTPYLIAEVPRQSVPANYNEFAGYPSNIKATLSDLTGYTEVETIYIKGIAATKTELDEIEALLKEGVII